MKTIKGEKPKALNVFGVEKTIKEIKGKRVK